MAGVDQEILIEFVSESRVLVNECSGILEAIEEDPSQYVRLEEYSNRIDRIMGAAQSIAMMAPGDHALPVIGDCAAMCKALGYRCMMSAPSTEMIETTVAFLLDATELVGGMLDRLDEGADGLRAEVKETLVERLRWISDLYAKMPAAAARNGHQEIEVLLKKLGMG